MLIIKKATKEDIKVLYQVYKGCTDFNNNKNEWIVVFDKDQPLGFAEIFLDKCVAEITMIYVNENERGQGLGDGILRTALNYIRAKGYEWAIFQKNKYHNECLSKFFIKEGFELLKDIEVIKDLREHILDYNLTTTYFCNISKFFQKGCKNSIVEV